MFAMILKEVRHRLGSFILSLLAVTLAVSLFVAFYTMSTASSRETIRLTRDMGFNLRIIPKETNMDSFWATGFSQLTMPEDYVLKFKKFKDFSYAHLAATLNERITLQGKNLILTGLTLKEVEPSGAKKSPMIFAIDSGTVQLGYEAARGLGLKRGENLELSGRKFAVAKVLPENGSDDDIRIFMQLPDAQQVLNKPGLINEIKALNCLCLSDPDANPLEILRSQLDQVLPDAKVVMNRTIAVARERQRIMVERYFAFILPIVVIVCGVWVGALALMNVKERKQEIGVLRALGYNSTFVALLILGKAVLTGIVGALLGYLLGTMLSMIYGPEIFRVTASSIKPMTNLLTLSLLFAPPFAAISSFIPAVLAMASDPAVTLREE